jgi:hypothetical protein
MIVLWRFLSNIFVLFVIRIQSLGHRFIIKDRKHFKTNIPVYRGQIVEMIVFIQIDGVKESSFFGCDVVVIFPLYVERVRQYLSFHMAKNVGLTIAGNFTAQVTDNEYSVILLENNAFPGHNGFQTDIGWSAYFICQFHLVIILVLGINAFTDRVKLAHFYIAIHAFFCQFDVRFAPNQRKFFEREDSVSRAKYS